MGMELGVLLVLVHLPDWPRLFDPERFHILCDAGFRLKFGEPSRFRRAHGKADRQYFMRG